MADLGGLGDLSGGPGAPGNQDLNTDVVILQGEGGVPPASGDFIMAFVRNPYYM